MPKLLFIMGPPAVGKMTVGQELSKCLDFPLFHNHLSIELTLSMFPWGSPEFRAINSGIRELVFTTAANSPDLKGFIFTVVMAFDLEDDLEELCKIQNQFKDQGWDIYYVELYSPLAIRLERNKTPNRLAHKASKRNLELSQENLLNMEGKYQMNTEHGLNLPNYLRLDNSDLAASEAAKRIMEVFGWSGDINSRFS